MVVGFTSNVQLVGFKNFIGILANSMSKIYPLEYP
jgi:hypothetical protein